MRLCRWVAVYLASTITPAAADDIADVQDITEVSLEDLLKTDVDVASKVPQTFREVPGVITVITREEIMDSGARDLEDVLMLVPGFSLGVDVEAVVGIGVRGAWGHEGKVLLMIDGQQMNETLYSTNQLGNHFPVDQIERIEIIRGPGSAIYGGYAELAVINIITRGADELDGVAVYGHAGMMTDTYGQLNLSLAAAQKFGDLKLSIAGLFGRGHRSNGTYTDFYGSSFELTDHNMDPAYVNFGAKWQDVSFRLIYDHYGADQRDGLGENEATRVDQRFIGVYSELAYKWKVNDKLTVTPALNYKRQLPWNITDMSSLTFYDKTAERVTAGAAASYDVKENINILGGAEIYYDHAFLNSPAIPDSPQTQFGTSDSVSYLNEAVYAQGLLNHEIANVTVGARFEHHSEFGNSLVPRVAVTKVLEPAHVKLLYSEAFRAPGFENINLAAGEPITPERTRIFETEVGYSIDAHNFVTFNGYWLRIKSPIVYFINMDGTEGYQNFSRSGTLGVEAAYKLRYKWGYFTASYSYYSAYDNEVPVYEVPGHSAALLGMPQHKVTLHGAYNVWKKLRLAPSFIVTSKPYAYTNPGDGMGVGTLTHADRIALFNLFASYRDLGGLDGLEAGIGIYNALDHTNNYYQPYDGGHAEMQGAARQLVVRVGYTRPL